MVKVLMSSGSRFKGVHLVGPAARVVLHPVRVEGLDFARVASDDEVHYQLPFRRQQQLLQLLRVLQLQQRLQGGRRALVWLRTGIDISCVATQVRPRTGMTSKFAGVQGWNGLMAWTGVAVAPKRVATSGRARWLLEGGESGGSGGVLYKH